LNSIPNSGGKPILLKMVAAIQKNKDYLSEVDGQIGDGDHGANMNKGFTLFGDRIAEAEIGFTQGLDRLGNLLFSEIGGSMGPIYGTIFMDMAGAGEKHAQIDLGVFTDMVDAGLAGLCDIVEARPGDKTLVDTLAPARDALQGAAAAGKDFAAALVDMKEAAARGKDSTRDMIAHFGRSSRLGERSRGVLDAGAVSCYIILSAMAEGILEQLKQEPV
jgi:dihydroxyacetone kinase-like protein